jgi:hypothetical protein
MNYPSTRLARLQWIGLTSGSVFFFLTCLGLFFSPHASFISFLVAYVFWFGLALGCLNVAAIHHLAGGAWGNVTRRFFEAGYMTLPVLAILFVPILFGLRELYPWMNPAAVAADKILKQKSVYENFPAFTVRAIFFFAVWIQIACCLRKWSLQQDLSPDISPGIKARTLSGPAIVIVPLTATFAFVDWVMSIETSWFSTIFSIILLAGGVLIALALGVIMLAGFQAEIPFAGAVTKKQFLDLGNLLLAFVMFWTYVAFSQLLIIYSGNQPREIGWYLHRIAGGWQWLVMFVALFQFLVPFLILLFRSYKENTRALAIVAALIFFVNALQNFWAVAPTFYPAKLTLHWTDLSAWLGIGGIWVGIFAANLKKHPLLIRNILQPEPALKKMSHEK